MNREEWIDKIRVNLGLDNSKTLSIERFQNDVLRPVLKAQHEILILLFNEIKQESSLHLYSDKDKLEFRQFIQKNVSFKSQLIGVVIGLFSSTEINYYLENKKEFNKRIIQMALERYFSTLNLK